MLSYMAIPFTFGIVNYGVREVAKGNEREVGNILSSRILLCLTSYVVSLFVIYFFIGVSPEMFLALTIGLIYLMSIAMNVEYYYIGTSNFKLPAISQITGQVVYVICILFFIKNQNDFIYLSIIYFCYYFISSSVLLFCFPKKSELNFNFSYKKAFTLLSRSYRLGISGLIENFSISLPLMIIGALLGNYETGIFSAAFKLIAILLLGFQTIITVVAPNLIKLKKQPKAEILSKIRFVTLTFVGIAAFSSLFSYIFGEQIIHLVYGDKYHEAVSLLKLFGIIYLPMLPLGMLFNSLLIYFEKDKHYLYTTITSFCILVTFTPVLIYKFSTNGAIYGMSLYMITYMSLSLYFVIKELRSIRD